MRRALAAMLLVLAGTSGCSSTTPSPAGSPDAREDSLAVETGIASFYAHKFHGRTTASGEVYDENALTAAHPTLPFGTRVRVTHRGNGKTVELRINDRGPFVDGRIIDVSYRAARELDFVAAGLATVRVEVLGVP